MPISKKVFFDRFYALLKNFKERYQLSTLHDVFLAWFAEYYFSLDSEDVMERIFKDSHAEGVDAILKDQKKLRLIFLAARTTESFEQTKKNFGENDVKSTLAGVRFLLRDNYHGMITPIVENLMKEYHELDKTGNYKTEIYFLAMKKEPVSMKYADDFRREFGQVDIHFVDFDGLYDFYTNNYLALTADPPEKISFQVLTNILAKDHPVKSRVFTCKAFELAKIYNDSGDRLFEQNVRLSLGLKSKSINRQICETAREETKSENFWYFNNGITIVCNELRESTSKKVINLKRPQIINGAQTTYALHDAYEDGNLSSKAEVLIKVIETRDTDFKESVTLYTNSQNPIRLRDLCSNDKIQKVNQRVLLDSYRYFYERKRGEFDSKYPERVDRKQLLGSNFRRKVVSNENAAQAYLAFFLDRPAEAKTQKGRIFLKDEIGFYDDVFNTKDSLCAEKLLLVWKLLRFIEAYKNNYNKTYKNAESLISKERNEVYKFDFVRHSDYFILNLLKDFVINEGLDLMKKRKDICKVLELIDNKDESLFNWYTDIKNCFADFILNMKDQPGYYHNKFFKSEKSIGLVRKHFNQQYKFVSVI